jgi:hypothetical protein
MPRASHVPSFAPRQVLEDETCEKDDDKELSYQGSEAPVQSFETTVV